MTDEIRKKRLKNQENFIRKKLKFLNVGRNT